MSRPTRRRFLNSSLGVAAAMSAGNLLAVLQDELHELVEAEQLVLGRKFGPVELAVEVFHEAELYADGGGGTNG